MAQYYYTQSVDFIAILPNVQLDSAKNVCESPAVCENTVGSFVCHCPTKGFIADGPNKCKDIDECAKDNGGCSLGAAKVNNF